MTQTQSDRSRRTLAVWLVVLGVIAIIVGFIVGKAATDGYRAQPPGMWLAYAAGGLCLIGALIAWLSAGLGGGGRAAGASLAPGWYDDPDDPRRLRYWDGSEWTAKTAGKEVSGS